MTVDIDQEQFAKHNNSHKVCQFIYGRALNAIYALDPQYKPSSDVIKEDMRIVIDGIDRLVLELIDSPIVVPDIIDIRLKSLREILALEVNGLGWNGFTIIDFLNLYKIIRESMGLETKFHVDENKFKIGQKVWYYSGSFVIESTILALDFCGLYYEIDEPVGHSICDRDCAATKEEAIREVKSWIAEVEKFDDFENKYEDEFSDLDEQREALINYIKSTHGEKLTQDEIENLPEEEREFYLRMWNDLDNWGIQSYHDKKRYEEWFTIGDVRKGKV